MQQDIAAWIEKLKAKARSGPPVPAVSCERCQDTGWVRVSDGIAERLQPTSERCDCRQRCSATTVLELPADFLPARLENYQRRVENAYAIEAVGELLAGTRKHLYLFGPIGSGKSRLAATVLNELAVRGAAGAFVRVPMLIMLQQLAFDDPSRKREANRFLDMAMNRPVVALDDIAGGEKGSDFTRGVMVNILDRRFDRRLHTIMTSNLNLQELSGFYDDNRIPSRIAGACGEVIEVAGSDQRLVQRPSAQRRVGMRLVDR